MSSSTQFSFIHFADDTTLYLNHKDPLALATADNLGLGNLDHWLRSNKLSLNITKTNYIIFSNTINSLPIPLSIRESSLSTVDSTKFLGIFIDNKLNFSLHTKHVTNKISRSIGIIKKISPLLPEPILKQLYHSLVMPYLIYVVEAWGRSNTADLNRLRSLQDRCIKLINYRHNNVTQLYKSLGILPFNCLYSYFVLKTFYKI